MREDVSRKCKGIDCNNEIPNTYNFCSFKCACSRGKYTARHYDMRITFTEEDIKKGAR